MSISIAKPSESPVESLEVMPLEWMDLQRRSELMRLRTRFGRDTKRKLNCGLLLLLVVAVVVVAVVVVVVVVGCGCGCGCCFCLVGWLVG